jgi:very-short-patch-repair endonuclease
VEEAPFGVLSLDQLVRLGVEPQTVRRRARGGRLFRVHQGVYSLMPLHLLSRRGRFLAAVLACGPEAVLSHRSAADLLGLRPTSRAKPEVTLARRSPRRPPGIEVHRSTTLTPADVTIVDSIPCTTPSRTIFDCSAVLPDRPVERMLEQAEVLEVLDATDLQTQLDRCPSLPGAARLTRVLGRYGPNSGPTESEFEERLLAVLRSGDVPEPERQQWVDPGDGEPPIRADFVWREQRLILETDGAAHHLTRHAFERDRHRDQRLARAGWRVVRVTWRQLTEDPDFIIRMLLELLATSSDDGRLTGAQPARR